jgi:hypothetical protein
MIKVQESSPFLKESAKKFLLISAAGCGNAFAAATGQSGECRMSIPVMAETANHDLILGILRPFISENGKSVDGRSGHDGISFGRIPRDPPGAVHPIALTSAIPV